MEEHKEIQRSLQVLLWIWFGTITSFCAVNVANIVKLETQVDTMKDQLNMLNDRITILKYQNLKNK
jgi:cell division protein FtsB